MTFEANDPPQIGPADAARPFHAETSPDVFRLLVEGAHDYAIFMLSPQGIVMTWNAGAQRLKGYRADEVIGSHFSRFYTAEALDADWPGQELRLAVERGRFEDEGWRLRKDGSRFWANVIITALRGPGGELLGFSKITRDLTERREHEEMLRQSEERFRLLIEGVKDHAIVLLDEQGRVASWNAGAEHVQGYMGDAVLGKHFALFYTPEDVEAGKPQRQLELAATIGFAEDTGWRMKADGTRFWADVTITALRDKDGHRQGFAHITRDLSERRRVQELEIEGKRINEFIAMLAHELRNPLTPIRNAVEIMEKTAITPELLWCKDMIGRQVAHLGRLVDDLLDISRITNGRIELKKERIELASLVSATVESLRAAISAQGHTLEVSLPCEPVLLFGDPTRLTQVIVNLLNNAAKYTPPGGTLRVELEQKGAEARLRVVDNGIGMSESLLKRAFDLFVQGDRALDRSGGGLGIGLALVRRIVGVHGGTVTASSAGTDAGSEFLVVLPALRSEDGMTVSRHEPAITLKPRNILVVDDNVDAARSMSVLLEMAGHRLSVAHDGTAALRAAIEEKPDLILLDIGLPGLDGYEVARRIRRLASLQGTRLVAMTGYGQPSDKQAAADAGFDAHIVKPIDYAALVQVIERMDGSAAA